MMSKRQIDSPLYTVPDAAKYLQLNVETFRELLKYGFIKSLDLGCRKVPRTELDHFIDKWTGQDIKGALRKAEDKDNTVVSSPLDSDFFEALKRDD